MCPQGKKEQAATKSDPSSQAIDRSEAWSEGWDVDIQLAARLHGPVLISAPPDDALAIARLIGSLEGDQVEIVTCDLAEGNDVRAAMADAGPGLHAGDEKRILLLREVQTLTRSDQTALMNLLAERQFGPLERSVRILASSSVDLFEYVMRGSFDERLFYWLNGIHILGLNESGATDAN